MVKLKSPEVMRPERQHSAAASEVVTMPLTKDEQHVDQYARSAGERPRAASKSDGLNFHAAQYTAPKKAAHGATLVTRSIVARRRKDGSL